jgi:O-antigen ligase
MATLMPWMPPAHRERCALAADMIACLIAVALPWSTSIVTILVWVWLLVALPLFDVASLRRILVKPAGGLAVLLVSLGLIGVAWAIGVPMKERWVGFGAFYKLLFIPALMLHFMASNRAHWVVTGFIGSCLVALALSGTALLFPHLPLPIAERGGSGVLVKDYIWQSEAFTVCAFLLAAVAFEMWRAQRRGMAVLLVFVIAALFGDMFAITASRTSLVVIPVLLLVFAASRLSWKGTAALIGAVFVFAAVVWSLNAELRTSYSGMFSEVRSYQSEGARSRAGERLEFWRKSIGFIAAAPVIGHGTGSIQDQFRKTVRGETGMAALASANPHNQTLAVAIQLGLLGVMVLFAMWAAHAALFIRGTGFAAWAGLVIVTQNIVGSLFNSHLFDFTQGWLYVIGVGVAAGVLLKAETKSAAPAG